MNLRLLHFLWLLLPNAQVQWIREIHYSRQFGFQSDLWPSSFSTSQCTPIVRNGLPGVFLFTCCEEEEGCCWIMLCTGCFYLSEASLALARQRTPRRSSSIWLTLPHQQKHKGSRGLVDKFFRLKTVRCCNTLLKFYYNMSRNAALELSISHLPSKIWISYLTAFLPATDLYFYMNLYM